MQLFYSTASPYARKALITAHEAGIVDQIEIITTTASPVDRNPAIVPVNPTGKIPTLVIPDGRIIFDSRVICEFFDRQSDTIHLFPKHPDSYIAAKTMESLGDGMLDAALLARYETSLRPEQLKWEDWHQGQIDKIQSSFDYLEKYCLELLNGPTTIGNVAVGCAIGYIEFRNIVDDWKTGRDGVAEWYSRFVERPSMKATEPS